MHKASCLSFHRIEARKGIKSRMKKVNASSIIIAVGALIIFWIISSSKVSTIYVLPVLGVICLLYGIMGIWKCIHAKEDQVANSLPGAVMQVVLGALLIALGVIEALGITLPKSMWDIALGVILAIAIIWWILRARGSAKKF